jgi:proline iminopeptidase
MGIRVSILSGAVAVAVSLCSSSVMAQQTTSTQSGARKMTVDVGGASLYVREIGRGQPLLVLHGGPDFDHRYLLPELDHLAGKFRLIYYDQRGRGLSAQGVMPEDVTLASDLSDLDRVRQHFNLETAVLLGNSWGAILALEYAIRYPHNVSALILMNPAPASVADLAVMRRSYSEKLGSELERQSEIVAGDAYRRGDPVAVAKRYRIHFRPAVKDPEQYEKLMARFEAIFQSQGPEGILKARRVEDQLMLDTWQKANYDLLPVLSRLQIPTLVIAGDQDFIPVEVARNIAEAMPSAELVTIRDCAHFSYLECPGEVRAALQQFLQR